MDFDRIMETVDVARLKKMHVTMVGGAYGLVRGLARCGLGGTSLVDFDRVGPSNPARQDLYSDDIGELKVLASAEDLRRVNPDIQVTCHALDYCSLDDEEHDESFGHTDLFIYGTDSFAAQARGLSVTHIHCDLAVLRARTELTDGRHSPSRWG